MKQSHLTSGKFLILMTILLSMACGTKQVSRELYEVSQIKDIQKREYLKVHMKNGELYLLTRWVINHTTRYIDGAGQHFDSNRRLLHPANKSGVEITFSINLDDIVVLETNDKGYNTGVPTMVLAGLLTIPTALACLMNPKGCFGSCPTFHVGHDNGQRLVAEGFSASICKSMEEIDVDWVDCGMPTGDSLEVIVKNEALETHMIKSVNLLDFTRHPDCRITRSVDQHYFEVKNESVPVSASHNKNSILMLISARDDQEWFSTSDSTNLAEKEEVCLDFLNLGSAQALLLDIRQSLLTTYLFYHALSVTGRATGYYYSEIERGNRNLLKRLQKFYDHLGGIEVFLMNDEGRWHRLGTVKEPGPIASDRHMVLLPQVISPVIHLKLRLSKGLWRINYACITQVEREVFPVRLTPEALMAGTRPEQQKLSQLTDENKYLVTFPGEEYRIRFPAIAQPDHEYFIESRGYYIEWMREEWLKYENQAQAKSMMMFPKAFLKKIAPLYKQAEPAMEKAFWASKYTHHED
ncbi:MAG: hypothetical protein JST46_16160 [Bacteroidetes bacterium]|nr:hypothetical protein [Bacteroidota bacterium]